ncbi:TetR/AcrR family transcriptional regulator [bacterium]|nr:TetR/AcrR family transcriptional regulator [bacterium]
MKSTREKILDTAERCFARQGIASASVRSIVDQARVNLGAITYHFGSKDNLVMEIFQRRMLPMTKERLDMLRRAREACGDAPIPLRRVIEAIVIPQYRLTSRFPQFIAFLVHMKNYPNAKFMKLINDDFNNLYEEIHHALRNALPPMSDTEFFLKLHFVIHMMDIIPKNDYQLRRLLPGQLSGEEITDVLMAFLEGGLTNRALHTLSNET